MPSFVITDKCDGCKGQDKTACLYICPNDLMALDTEKMKAYNREPAMCWECYNCVKICPQQAIDVRGYADFMPVGASVVPIRTTPEGAAPPDGGFAYGPGTLDDQLLATEPASLRTDELWTLGK